MKKESDLLDYFEVENVTKIEVILNEINRLAVFYNPGWAIVETSEYHIFDVIPKG